MMPMSSTLAERGLAVAYRSIRDRTRELVAPLSAEDCCVQSMPDASPAKWHLAHTTWFFETFVLERWQPGYRPFRREFRYLFNSYYDAVGERHPRPQRGLLTRPSLEEVLRYREETDQRMLDLLDEMGGANEVAHLVELGLHHEQQHQELLLTDIKHLFSMNPLAPAYGEALSPSRPPAPLAWHEFNGGLVQIGHAGAGFAWDNEQPRHPVFVAPFRLASRLVTNGEYLDFIDAGGYEDPRLWLSEGWEWAQMQAQMRRLVGGGNFPLYWRRGDAWQEYTLGGLSRLDLLRPVVHVSYYEADAYARWTGARLPTEAEWEVAIDRQPAEGNFAVDREFHPKSASQPGLCQMYGDAWEWTSSDYGPYPGFRTAAGAIGEYNGKFMINQRVLRGGSCATPPGHIRPTYRNFFPAPAAWQFSGIRLARDLRAG